MNKELLVEELRRIKSIVDMKEEELVEAYPHLKEGLNLPYKSLYANKAGVMEAEIYCLIERIERDELG